MDAKIKESERELIQLRIQRDELVRKEELEEAQQMERVVELRRKRELELTQHYEKTRKVEESRRDTYRKKSQNDMNMLKAAIQALVVRRNVEVSGVQNKFESSFARDYKKINEEMTSTIQSIQSSQLEEFTLQIQDFTAKVRGYLESEISIIHELVSTVKGCGSHDVLSEDDSVDMDESLDNGKFKMTSGLVSLCSFLRDEPKLMTDVVSSVLAESRKRARESHLDSLSLIPCDSVNSDSVTFSGGYPCISEHKDELSNEHWSRQARLVTGPENALYAEPSEAPLFQEAHAEYMCKRLLVREHIRSKKRKLHHRWKELCFEYLDRQRSRADEQCDSKEYVTENMDISTLNNEAQDYGARGNNPYRRPRRVANLGSGTSIIGSDVVRSEYEQEQIIAKLTAQEALEKKIIYGGCPLPRQRCAVEKVSV